MNNSCAKTTLNPTRPYYRPTLDYYKVVADRSSHINLIFSISSSHYSTCVHTVRGGEVGGEGGMECFSSVPADVIWYMNMSLVN